MAALTFASLGWALLIDFVVAVVAFSIFNVFRNWHVTRPFYTARRHLNIPFRYRPPKLPDNIFTWWIRVLQVPETDVLACSGADALTYIRIVKLGLKISFYVGLVVLCVVLPVNWGAGSAVVCTASAVCSTPDTKNLANFDYTTLANIPNKSNLMWVHLCAVYVISAIVMRLLWTENKQAVALRIRYLTTMSNCGESHTALVRNIPGVYYGTLVHRIGDYIDSPLAFFIPRRLRAKAAANVEKGVSIVKRGTERAVQELQNIDGGKVLRKIGVKAEPLDVYTTPDAPRDGTQPEAYPGASPYMPVDEPTGGLVSGTTYPLPPSVPHAGLTLKVSAMTDPDADRGTVPITQRFLDLKNRSPERSATDFDTWHQAEAALASGMSVEELVRREFLRTYSEHDVEQVTVVKDTERLRGLARQYETTKNQVEDLIDLWNSKLLTGKPVKLQKVVVVPQKYGLEGVAKWGKEPTRVESSEFLEWRLNYLCAKVREAQAEAKSHDTCAAFVTLRRRLLQSYSAHGLHYHNEKFWKTEPAPGPRTVMWGNVALREWEEQLRFGLAWTLFVLILVFYTIPVTALQGLLQINQWKSLPGMSTILANQFLHGIVSAILPGLALRIFLAVLPSFLTWINILQGIHSAALVDFEVGRKFYGFLYIQVFIVFIVGGSLITNANNLANNPSNFVQSLGQVIPSTASFYLTYVLVEAFIAVPISIIRVLFVVVYLIRYPIVGSDRTKRRFWAHQYYIYGRKCPGITFTLLLLLTFGIMTPFISVACMIYYFVALLVGRFQLLYVFRENYQSGGCFWPLVFQQLMAGLFTFQIVMFAVLSVKQFAWSPLLLIPIVASAIFLQLVSRHFSRPLTHLSAHAAADMDRADVERPGLSAKDEADMLAIMDCDETALGRREELYIAPAFKVTENHDELPRELAAARRRIGTRQRHLFKDLQGDDAAPDTRPEGMLSSSGGPLHEGHYVVYRAPT